MAISISNFTYDGISDYYEDITAYAGSIFFMQRANNIIISNNRLVNIYVFALI